MTNSNIILPNVPEEMTDFLKAESTNLGNECLNAMTAALQEDQTMSHGNGLDASEELIDVKVCDICGDAGREALLAHCSVCSDGAEHTYCMRNRMDKLPENGWMCEECVGMQEPKGQTQAIDTKAYIASNPSSSKETTQLSSRKSYSVQQAGKSTVKYPSKNFCFSGTRHVPYIKKTSTTKKRKGEEIIRPLKARISSMNSIVKENRSVPPVSLNSEKRFCKGSSHKIKTDDVSELNILPKIHAAKADSKLGKNIANKKPFKSLSLASSAANSDAPNPRLFSVLNSNGRKMRGTSSRNNIDTEAAEALHMLSKQPVLFCRDNNEKLPSGHSNDAISCRKKDANSSAGYNRHSSASRKVLGHELELQPVTPPVRPTLAPAKTAFSRSSVVPSADYIWKGGFKLEKSSKLLNYCGVVQAHMSSGASSKVNEVVMKFGSKLEFKEAPRSETLPTYFRPTDHDIALYFFAEDMQSYRRSYKVLLDGMMEKDLALVAEFDDIQLLVLPSTLLPESSQRWNSLFYLWGVCKLRRIEDHSPRLLSLNVTKSNLDLYTPITNPSPSKCVSTVEDGSLSASQASHNSSAQGPETVCPLLLQSSVLNNSSYQSRDHGTSSMLPDAVKSVDDMKEETSLRMALHADNMLKGIQSDNQDIFSQANGENTVSLALNPEKFSFGPDPASHSSFSFDSGPSGTSDGSDFNHREQSDNKSLNLDLCLGFNSQVQPDEQADLNLNLDLDLDLILGPKKYTTGNSNPGNKNVSLFLSLGMPCSNA